MRLELFGLGVCILALKRDRYGGNDCHDELGGFRQRYHVK